MQLAFGEVKSEDKAELAKLVSAIKSNYTDKNEEARKHWGGGIRGHKSACPPPFLSPRPRSDCSLPFFFTRPVGIAKLEGRARAAGQDPNLVSHTV